MKATLQVTAYWSTLAIAASLVATTIFTAPAYGSTSLAQASFSDEIRERAAERREKSRERAEELREEARERAEKIRERLQKNRNDERSERSNQPQRGRSCEKQPAKLTDAMERFSKQASRHLSVFDGVHQRVQSFHDDNQIVDPDYEDLNSAVISARENTNDKITLLSQLHSSFNCLDNETASLSFKEFRDIAKTTTIDLKTYRSSLVLLIQSLRVEATSPAQPEAQQPES